MKKFYFALASMICLFVAVSFVSCDKTDDEDPTSSSSSSSGGSSSSEGGSSSSSEDVSSTGLILPCLNWDATPSMVKKYMEGYSNFFLYRTATNEIGLQYRDASERQILGYTFDFLSDPYALYQVMYTVTNSSQSEFDAYKSFLVSKLSFTSMDQENDEGGVSYTCTFNYGGKSHSLFLSYIKSARTMRAVFMEKKN